MRIRSILAALAMTVGFLFGGAATASVIDVEIGTAPPQERVETVPPPRAGYVYERGHYVVDNDRYVWHEGHFIKEREGHHWQPYVLERHGDRWHYRAGHWDDEG